MKPPPFTYHAPRSLDEALALLARHGDEAKVLAGGQSLIPLLNFRLARPAHLVDVTRIPDLASIQRKGDALVIWAAARQAALERSSEVAMGWPILLEAVRYVGHPQIRNLGTVGGSVAHADPAAELPAVLSLLDARFHVRSARGPRQIAAEDFFLTYFTTALEADELLVEIEAPPVDRGTGHAFVEFARRDGDFALGGAGALMRRDERGRCERVAIVVLGAATPWRPREVEAALAGSLLDGTTIEEAAIAAVRDFEPGGDIHGSAEYRKSLAGTMVRRALTAAANRNSQVPIREGASQGP